MHVRAAEVPPTSLPLPSHFLPTSFPLPSHCRSTPVGIALYCIVLHCIALHCIALHCGFSLRVRYFADGFNCTDFVVVCISIASLVSDEIDASFIVVARIFRVALKLVRLIRTNKNLKEERKILDLISKSTTSIASVGGLLLLLILIYATIGMKLFSNAAYDDNITRHANFRTFDNAILLLIRCMTVLPLAYANRPACRSLPSRRLLCRTDRTALLAG